MSNESNRDVVGARRGDVAIRSHQPGDLGHVVSRHGVLYNREYGFDISFEAAVARIAAEFIEGFNARWCCARIAVAGDAILGAAFVVRSDAQTAKLRLVYVEPDARGIGLGRRLVGDCLQFAVDAGYQRLVLGTHDILVPARRLYASLGFRLIEARPFTGFGRQMRDETWQADLARP